MKSVVNPVERFKRNYLLSEDGCWNWQKYTNRGYARFNNGERIVDAHRWYYQVFYNIKLNTKQHLDHLCRNRKCVNPGHLEIVTNKTNWLRGNSITRLKSLQTHCIHGHELVGKNVYVRSNKRRCNTCHKLKAREYRKNKK